MLDISLDKIIQRVEKHKYELIIHFSILFALALWSLNKPAKQPPAPIAAREATSKQVLPKAAATVAGMSGFAPKEPVKLDEPKDDPITNEELKEFDGTKDGKPIYVAIRGTVFDVSAKKEMYGPGGGYSIFAGKDASRGLGKSSLKPEDAVSDYSTLDTDEMKVLDDWFTYFSKRYNIVGKVSS